VGAVLGDALLRVAMLGGREGVPRSLGSVYGGSVTRFLGGSLRGVVSRVIATPDIVSYSNGIAVSNDGCTLLVSDTRGRSSRRSIREYVVANGRPRRIIRGCDDELRQLAQPQQVCIAPDGFVFVADYRRDCVQVLTPALDFHGFVGAGCIEAPVGVCANADVVVVSECEAHRISVFSRRDGALLRRFGCDGSGDGQLEYPLGLCFMSGDRHVAVADAHSNRVSVFSVGGDFIRHVGVGALHHPLGVACSAFGELVVADFGHERLALFGDDGGHVASLGSGRFTGVCLHGSTVFAFRDGRAVADSHRECVVFV
jgi:DNA-binding beta-propeller fold protein YncE